MPHARAALRIAAVLLALLFSGLANATLLAPGDTNVPIIEKAFDATPIIQKSRPFTFGNVSGTVTDAVISVDGFLAFETQVTLTDAPSTFSVDQILRTSYAGFTTDARPETDRGGPRAPSFGDRSADGSIVSFDFTDAITTTGSSSFFVILTNATKFAETGTLQLGSGGELSPSITVFTPVASVPEPSECAMLVVAGALLALRLRRSRRA
jgi:hypothetical protein